MMDKVTVVGAGLAGCEAAWQLVKRKIPVRLCGNAAENVLTGTPQ